MVKKGDTDPTTSNSEKNGFDAAWAGKKEKMGKEIAEALYDYGMIKTWYRDKPEGWTLHSGLWSPFYVNLRNLGAYPELFKKVGKYLAELIKNETPSINCVVGIATAGVPIASVIASEGGFPLGYTRKIEGVKTAEDFQAAITKYGQHAMVEGVFNDGDSIALVDDLVTRLSSKLIAVEQFREEMKRRNVKADSKTIIVLLDREQGAKEMAAQHGLELYSLIPFRTKGIHWLKDKLTNIEYETITGYLSDFNNYQDATVRESLKKAAK